jgi:hypothetical protein
MVQFLPSYICSMRRYGDGEQKMIYLKLVTDLHIFSAPEYENVAFMRRYCCVKRINLSYFDRFACFQHC